MFFRCGIRMSFRQVRKPQAKNSVETIAMARRSVLWEARSSFVLTASDWLRIAMWEDPEKMIDRSLA
jgi:hypothetical protein